MTMSQHGAARAKVAVCVAAALLAAGGVDATRAFAEEDDLWSRDRLTGDWGGWRSFHETLGMTLELGYTAETLGNVKGGFDVGFGYEGRVEAGLALDLEKLLGWTGASIYASAFHIHYDNGTPAVNYVGSLADPSNIEATQATRLFTAWFEQNLFEDALSIRIGQLAADDEFITSDTAGGLINGTFGWPVFMSANLPNGGAAYPLAAPGVRVQVKPTDNLALLAGVFAGDPAGRDCLDDPQICNNHGTTFQLTGGTLAIGEVQYAINGAENAPGLPGVYKIGAWFQGDGAFAEQRFGTPRDDDYGFYAVADQTVLASDTRSLSLFARIGVTPADRNLVSFYADGGFGVTGLIPSRADDVLTLGVAYMDISGYAENADRDAAVAPVRDHEIAVELSYVAQIAPWWTLQPDLQYIVHPGGNVAHPVTGEAIDDALIVGVRTSLTF